MSELTQRYLEKYLQTLSVEKRKNYTSFSADYFCADEENANFCAKLIKEGKKTATCSMKQYYEVTGEQLPTVGHLQVVTDWDGNPTSIIEIEEVSEKKYVDIDERFAKEEGEGDLSLEWWRTAHWEFFSKECESLGISPTLNMILVLERFKVVFP